MSTKIMSPKVKYGRHVKNTKFSLDPKQLFCFLYESPFSFWGPLESKTRGFVNLFSKFSPVCAVPVPRPCRARSLTNFNRCFALAISAAVLKTAEVSNESAESLTNVRFKKNLIKKKKNLYCWIRILLKQTIFVYVRGLWNYLIIIMRNYFPPKRR